MAEERGQGAMGVVVMFWGWPGRWERQRRSLA